MPLAPAEHEVDAVAARREGLGEVEPDPLRAGAVRTERADEQREVAAVAHRAFRNGAKIAGSTKRRFFSRNEDFCQNARNASSTKSK